MILRIRTLGDPVLRDPAKPVTEFGSSLRTLYEDMIETMRDAPGVGLAGPQVGVSLQLFVFDDGDTGPMFMANPELLDPVGELLEDEGCLSIPGPYHETPRFRKIRSRLYAKYPQYPGEAALDESDSVVVEVIPTHVFSWGVD